MTFFRKDKSAQIPSDALTTFLAHLRIQDFTGGDAIFTAAQYKNAQEGAGNGEYHDDERKPESTTDTRRGAASE